MNIYLQCVTQITHLQFYAYICHRPNIPIKIDSHTSNKYLYINYHIMNICTFFQVPITGSHGLLIFDIDETLLTYPEITNEWWKKTFMEFYNTNGNNYDEADKQSLIKWITHTDTHAPQYTDKDGLFDLLKRAAKYKIICVSARSEEAREKTINNLSALNIPIHELYLVGDEHKSVIIKKLTENEKYDDIIFIDDLESNITDVATNIPCVTCYQFCGY
jgi:uncharacterized HAD superfamily protein